MRDELTQDIAENALKFTYLAHGYPKKNLRELTEMMNIPGIDVNLALWHAIDEGWILDPAANEEGDEQAHLGEIQPKTWDFGPAVAKLQNKILMAFSILAIKQVDLQWEFLSQWLVGYSPRDVTIALRQMLHDGKLMEYKLADPEDTESIYDFYTLPENRQYLWGAKSFKIQPTEEAVVAEDEAPEEE